MQASWGSPKGYFSKVESNQAQRIYLIDRGGNMMGVGGTRSAATHSTVIARFNRAIQYAETFVIEPRSHGVLDAPVTPGMTAGFGAAGRTNFHHAILPLICPTMQTFISLFPNFRKIQRFPPDAYCAWGCFRIFRFERAAPAATLQRQPPPSR
ncbi:hypothetical protein [Bradyrhizobium guangxiense]|uniref:hypothetical protein n=1 Tax=Bradyrhizobium guangxiense TaxID=1325115 RepID=UPI0013E8BDA6|nr:hypothetical protein [Bradyrhizobium guangxiense]